MRYAFLTIIITAWEVSVFGIFLVRIFPYSDLMQTDKEYLSVFSPNMGKYGPEKLQIRTLFKKHRMFLDKKNTFPVKRETTSSQKIIETDGRQFCRTGLLGFSIIIEIPSCILNNDWVFCVTFSWYHGSHWKT